MMQSYDTESEKKISALLLKDGWAENIHWDRNDWYIHWSEKAKGVLYRIPAILTYWYDLSPLDLKCVDFMTRYFGLHKGKHDAVATNMQEAIIGLAQKKLQKALPNPLLEKIRNRNWSYMGLEMILDTIRASEAAELESYLQNL